MVLRRRRFPFNGPADLPGPSLLREWSQPRPEQPSCPALEKSRDLAPFGAGLDTICTMVYATGALYGRN